MLFLLSILPVSKLSIKLVMRGMRGKREIQSLNPRTMANSAYGQTSRQPDILSQPSHSSCSNIGDTFIYMSLMLCHSCAVPLHLLGMLKILTHERSSESNWTPIFRAEF